MPWDRLGWHGAGRGTLRHVPTPRPPEPGRARGPNLSRAVSGGLGDSDSYRARGNTIQEKASSPAGRPGGSHRSQRGSSPSRAGMTVLRSASTSPSGEPKRKKPDTLKSRRVLAPSAPSGAAELPRGASASSGASLGCGLQQHCQWAWESQRCTHCSPVSPEELLEAGELRQGTAPIPCSLPGWCRSKIHPLHRA